MNRPAAFAQAAEQLPRYRAEFFGKLREALAGQRDVQFVGDRFVIQSEVLFRSGAAGLQPGAERLLSIVARQLIDFSSQLPRNANWILQVEGHTDSTPISNALYPSNLELSTARAVAVVKFLNSVGVPNDVSRPPVIASTSRCRPSTMPATGASSSSSSVANQSPPDLGQSGELSARPAFLTPAAM